jgi:putative ABC transport system permease protein
MRRRIALIAGLLLALGAFAPNALAGTARTQTFVHVFVDCVTQSSGTYDATFLTVRAAGDAASVYPVVRQAVSELDRDLPLSSVMPMQARVASATSRTRFSAELLGVFAGLAALLAGIGIYGVISYSVAARTREIGIRMALGARAGTVLRSVAIEGVGLAALGVALGIPAALAATRVLSTMLFEVKPGDPSTLAAISALLVIIAFAATLVPALRAARVDPMEALRHE